MAVRSNYCLDACRQRHFLLELSMPCYIKNSFSGGNMTDSSDSNFEPSYISYTSNSDDDEDDQFARAAAPFFWIRNMQLAITRLQREEIVASFELEVYLEQHPSPRVGRTEQVCGSSER